MRRVAVNLSGIEAGDVRRGHALVRAGQWHVSGVLDVSVTVLDASPQSITGRGAFAAYLGTASPAVRLKLIGDRERIAPGETGEARMWMLAGRRVAAVPGDRFVLREVGRGETIGGGVVLDVAPVLPASKARPSISLDRVVAERGWVRADELERLTGQRAEPSVGPWVIAPAAEAAAAARVTDVCRRSGGEGLNLARLDEIELALVRRGVPGVAVQGPRAYLELHLPRGLSERASALLDALQAAGVSPPDIPLHERGALRELEAAGLAVQTGDTWFATAAVGAAVERLRELLRTSPQGFTVSGARQALGTSRKYALPLLAHLDANGVTRRQGDLRVAGPRMGP